MIYTKRAIIINDNDLSSDINSKASTTTAIAEEQRIYYRSLVEGPPSGAALPTTWITNNGDIWNNTATVTATNGWTRKITPIANGTGSTVTKYLYLYTCIQKKTVSGDITYTPILLDESTTVIDGGNIITGSIAANKISVQSLSAIKADLGTITAGVIKHDTVGGTGGIWISADTDTPNNVTVGTSGARKDWRLLVNNTFGVTTGGGLYATSANISGEIEATSGTIGGCTIDANGKLWVPAANITGTLTASQVDVSGIITSGGIVTNTLTGGTFNTTDYIRVSTQASSSLAIGTSGSKTDWRIIAGKTFGVDKSGNLYATSVNLTGAIDATSGTIGSDATSGNRWQIGSQSIWNGISSMTSTTASGIYIGVDGIRNYNATSGAYVNITNGKITAQAAEIHGEVYADEGMIGGWRIGTDTNKSLHNGSTDTSPTPASGTVILSKGLTLSSASGNLPAATYAITAGTNFGVTTDGTLYATGAVLGNYATQTYANTAASNERSTYITVMSSTGIAIHPSTWSQTEGSSYANYLLLNGDGLNIYKGGVSVALYGENARVGPVENGYSRVELSGTGIDFKRQTSSSDYATLAHIGYDEGNASSGTDTAPYYTFGTRASSISRNNESNEWTTYTGIGNWSTSGGSNNIAAGYCSSAEGYNTIAKGVCTHAEGYATLAAGHRSHAEGDGTYAVGRAAHAEGSSAIASGHYAHAEGDHTTASSSESHAEGNHTTASGYASHAEGGYTTASGSNSHAEGYYATADGSTSHAGGFGVIAGYSYQTVIGKYNNNNADSAFEIGWGTSSTSKNILTVKNDGDLYVTGNIYYGCDGDGTSTGGTQAGAGGGGGASITLNGSSTSSASFYAPTSAGTSGYYLKSNGSNSAPTWTSLTIPSITLNGSSNTTPSFYAPTTAGTNGYYLKSNGSGAPSWTSFPTIPTIKLNNSTNTSPSFYAPTTGGTSGYYLKSNGSTSAPTWASLTVPSITLNGSSNTSPSFYAPTSAGTSGQYLKSNGSGAPSWATLPISGTSVQYGTTSSTISVSNNSYASQKISFGSSFSSAPTVVACFKGASTAYAFGSMSISVYDVTETEFYVRIFNNGTGATRTPYVSWIAVGN